MSNSDRTMMKTPQGYCNPTDDNWKYIAKNATATNPPDSASVVGMSIVPTFIWDDWPATVKLKAYGTWFVVEGTLNPPEDRYKKWIGQVGYVAGGGNQDITLSKSSTPLIYTGGPGGTGYGAWYIDAELCYFNPDNSTKELRWRIRFNGVFSSISYDYYTVSAKGPTTDGIIGGVYTFYSNYGYPYHWYLDGNEEIVAA